jgi:hypothetical protein
MKGTIKDILQANKDIDFRPLLEVLEERDAQENYPNLLQALREMYKEEKTDKCDIST